MKTNGIVIRKLTAEDMPEAVGLRCLCWPEETAGMTSEMPDADKELAFFRDWMARADEADDVRLLLCAFESGGMLGTAFGSFVE